jgi:methylthioribose-1-phosphate isomerase
MTDATRRLAERLIADRTPLDADEATRRLAILDQTRLPHAIDVLTLADAGAVAHAIRSMQVRGAPLIGATAAFGLAFALRDDATDAALAAAVAMLAATRPTAVNLAWALARVRARVAPLPASARADAAWLEAQTILAEDRAQNAAIGRHGLDLLRAICPRNNDGRHANGKRLELMTHCNAGWLATGGGGTALAPIFAAQAAGVPLHVWVSETRPRNQGLLTAWELAWAGIPHTVIADNAAGLLIAQGRIDAVIVGADRIAANGDVANKVGTYLKALACEPARVPFYVAAPQSTIDWACDSGARIPIEERDGDELRLLVGIAGQRLEAVRQLPAEEPVGNPAFDVTPAHLVRAIITERGPANASASGLLARFPKRSRP